MLERCRDRLDVSRSHDDSLNAVAHDIASFACGDLRQRAGGRLIGDFCATFPLRGENMNCALAEIIFRIAHKSHKANVFAPELLEIRLRFVMYRADKP